MNYDDILARAQADHLDIFGAFHPNPDDGVSRAAQTLLLLGPHEPGFWAAIKSAPEWDGLPDPIDRWSERIINQIAADLGGTALYPFGGPPFQPFIAWALKSGRAWQSPVSLLVHDTAGLMVSYRGAIALPEKIELPSISETPCTTCEAPCVKACPVGALDASGYDVAACHNFLETPQGSDCMTNGCQVRRACPVSQSYGRVGEQSAYHMSIFHKGDSA